MIHFIYKTKNLANGKFYLGKHSTRNTQDGYLGSGKLLKKAIAKYGKENFKREILHYFESVLALDEAEREIITLQVIKDPNCYNLATGGGGGMVLKHITTTELTLRAAATLKANPDKLAERNKKIGQRQLEHLKRNPKANDDRLKKMNDGCRGTTKENNPHIQKQIANRRSTHVKKMNDVMSEMAKHDWQQKNVKPLIALLGISGSTFGRMRERLRNGQTTWE